MIGVLGHVHTGTTCLARCLQQAGLSFGTNCNTRLEDYRLFQIYNQKFFKITWQERSTRIQNEIINDEEIQAIKHPYLAATLEHWPMLTSHIATIRSPLAWVKRFRNKSYDLGLQSWLKTYAPIAAMNIPMVWFDSETLKEDMMKTLGWLGLTYRGGLELEKRRHARPTEDIPQTTQQVWRQLQDGIHRTKKQDFNRV